MSPYRSHSAPALDDYLLELLKIVNGALAGDKAKVITYAYQLADKLESEGAVRAAEKLRRAIAGHLHGGIDNPSRLAGVAGRVPVDSESRLPLADLEVLRPDATEVFLDPVAQARLSEFLRYTESASELLAHGVGIAPTVLVYGPPGCGKTEIARYVSARLQLPLLTARSDSLISSFLGSTAKNVRLLFESAMSRPCVLFLDEFDALAKKRDDNNELGELKRVVISLLQNIDALDGKTVIIAATNHEHLLDPAVWRRFSYRIQVARPDLTARTQLFRRFLHSFEPVEGLEIIAAVAEGLTGADVKAVSEDCVRHAILDGKQRVDLETVLRRVLLYRLGHDFSGLPTAENIRAVRNLNEQVFTYRILSRVFDVSLGKLTKVFAEEEVGHG